MKRIDRLIIGELLGPWVFGVAIFTVLIAAGQFLFQITEYLAAGANVMTTMKLMGLLMPGVMAKTFSMAVLLSSLLAFGRLSGDSEIVALRAGGVSVARIMVPVGLFGLLVFFLALLFNEKIVPSATYQAIDLRIELEGELDGKTDQPTSRSIYEDGELKMMLVARDFDINDRMLSGVVLVVYGSDGKPETYVYTELMEYTNESNWRFPNGGEIVSANSGFRGSFGQAGPDKLPKLDVTPNDLILPILKDLDALSMKQMKQLIDREKSQPVYDEKQVSNLEFGYWNKLALPLAALVFGLVGAPLGIRNHRAGTATGFALSVVIIFGYMMLANAMSIMAQGGRIPAFVASFTPIVIGLVVAIVLIQRRNR